MNRVCLVGRLTANPELRTTSTNKNVCQFSIAVNRDKEKADFLDCTVWEKQAENLCKYQKKGSLISIEGQLRKDSLDKADGNKEYRTYVYVNQIEYLSSKNNDNVETKSVETKIEENDPFAEFGESVDIDNFLD